MEGVFENRAKIPETDEGPETNTTETDGEGPETNTTETDKDPESNAAQGWDQKASPSATAPMWFRF